MTGGCEYAPARRDAARAAWMLRGCAPQCARAALACHTVTMSMPPQLLFHAPHPTVPDLLPTSSGSSSTVASAISMPSSCERRRGWRGERAQRAAIVSARPRGHVRKRHASQRRSQPAARRACACGASCCAAAAAAAAHDGELGDHVARRGLRVDEVRHDDEVEEDEHEGDNARNHHQADVERHGHPRRRRGAARHASSVGAAAAADAAAAAAEAAQARRRSR